MQDTRYKWRTLSNPFLYSTSMTGSGIIGHVSGRSKDIINIVYSDQSAIILSGAPRIGKTALLRYLQTSPTAPWSWRQEEEILLLQNQKVLNAIHFAQIDLTPLESIYQNSTEKEIYQQFLEQCGQALRQIYGSENQETPIDLKSIRDFLRQMKRNQPDIRCFLLLDNIDRLGLDTPSFLQRNTRAKTPQELGIALLDSCEIIRALTGLIDEFSNFGVILALESLPRAKMDAQFSQVSADLAHFSTTTLQAFTWNDAQAFLAQTPEQFGDNWKLQFAERGGTTIFSPCEQQWIHEQAGTHPYILQQFCLHTFYFKQLRAERDDQWTDIEDEDKPYLIQQVKTQIITFLNRLWKRLQGALDTVDADTRERFFSFISSLAEKPIGETFTSTAWNDLGTDIQYILSNEGIVRYDPFQPVHYPGALLSDYLTQKVADTGAITARQTRLIINFPEKPSEPILLSKLEYNIMKTLLQQYPKRSTEAELVKAGWGATVESKTFTQRMYQLRKKLKGESSHEIIANHYGGFYSLPHPEWLHLLE